MIDKIDKSNWQSVKFGQIAALVTDSIKDPASAGITRYVGLEHLSPKDINIHSWGNISEGTTFTRVFRRGDVLFGRRRAYQKKAALADFDGVCSGDILALRARTENLLPELLPYIVQSDKFFDYAVRTSAGSLSPRTKYKDLAELEFKIPPLEDQGHILRGLALAQEQINTTSVLIDDLEVLFKVMLNEFIKKPDVHSSVGSDVTFLKGISYKAAEISDNGPGTPIISLKCFEKFGGFSKRGMKYFTGAKIPRTHLLEPGDLVIAATDITRAGDVVGFPIFVPHFEEKPLFTMDVMKLVINKDRIDPLFLYYLLRTQWGHWHMFAHASGTTVLHLDGVALSKLPFPEIAITQQKLIAGKLAKIEESIRLAHDNLKSTKELARRLSEEIF